MRTSFHHQPEAQHPKSSAIHELPADYPIYWQILLQKSAISEGSGDFIFFEVVGC